eukprot:365985-Chlamydomonas_euryale.AAC.15
MPDAAKPESSRLASGCRRGRRVTGERRPRAARPGALLRGCADGVGGPRLGDGAAGRPPALGVHAWGGVGGGNAHAQRTRGGGRARVGSCCVATPSVTPRPSLPRAAARGSSSAAPNRHLRDCLAAHVLCVRVATRGGAAPRGGGAQRRGGRWPMARCRRCAHLHFGHSGQMRVHAAASARVSGMPRLRGLRGGRPCRRRTHGCCRRCCLHRSSRPMQRFASVPAGCVHRLLVRPRHATVAAEAKPCDRDRALITVTVTAYYYGLRTGRLAASAEPAAGEARWLQPGSLAACGGKEHRPAAASAAAAAPAAAAAAAASASSAVAARGVLVAVGICQRPTGAAAGLAAAARAAHGAACCVRLLRAAASHLT